MIRLIRCAVFALFLVPTMAVAQEFPTVGLLYDQTENSSLTYECFKDAGLLKCDFVQVFVRQGRTKEPAEIEAGVEGFLNELEAKSNVLEEGFCPTFELADKALKGDITEVDIAESGAMIDLGPVEFTELVRKQYSSSSLQKAVIESALKVCANPTKEMITSFVQAANDVEVAKCRVGTNSFSQTFKYVDDYSGRSAWVVSSEPEGPCGIIQLSRFVIDESVPENYKLWDYFSQKFISNKGGTASLGLSCSDLDEGEYPYSWRSKTYNLQCNGVEFSPF